MATGETLAAREAVRVGSRLSRRALVQGLAGIGAASILGACVERSATPVPRPSPGLSTASPRPWSIGYLSGNASRSAMNYARPFLDELHELGHVPNRDFDVQY